MQEVYLSTKETGVAHNPTTAEKQEEIVEKLEDVFDGKNHFNK